MILFVEAPSKFDDYPLFENRLNGWQIEVLYHSGENPTAKYAKKYALSRNIECKSITANFGLWGKSALKERNAKIFEAVDVVIVFNNGSKKTEKLAKYACKAGKPTQVIHLHSATLAFHF